MSNKTELLPCPFCGGEAKAFQHGYVGYVVQCRRCGIWNAGYSAAWSHITEDEFSGFIDEESAIAAWNTRIATTDAEFARAVHDGNLWRRVKGHIRCRNCGLNIESVIALDGCNEHAIKHCPNCGHKVVG